MKQELTGQLKYPPHYEVARKGYFEVEYLTSKGGWCYASGMTAAKPKAFRSSKAALAAAVKHNASLIVYWLEEGETTYNRLTLFGTKLLPDMDVSAEKSQDRLDHLHRLRWWYSNALAAANEADYDGDAATAAKWDEEARSLREEYTQLEANL